ncbi:transcriptional regulator [Ralstonia mannitolilytica]|uniref:transcriptional regulator n=1 Tax=Ralstonia mannitolilytica TaxID=105219 RepID=UPI00292E70E3|nr:YdaS family helix-turn-helix protein [Ralstonia mannitolilytica]
MVDFMRRITSLLSIEQQCLMFGKQCFMLVSMSKVDPQALEAIREAVEKVGGPSSLARLLMITPQMVTQWISEDEKRRRPVAAIHCPSIESATGISRKRLRPADWQRLWPELQEREGAAA